MPRTPTRTRSRTHALLAAALAGLVLAACGGGGASTAPPGDARAAVGSEPATTTTNAPTTTTTVAEVTKVLVVGDSSGVDAGPALGAMFASIGADTAMAAGTGFGLTAKGISYDYSDFRTDFPRVLDEESPDLVVVLVGIWDGRFIERYGIDAYTPVVDEAVTILSSKGAHVLLLAMPPGGKYPDRVQNGPFQAVAATHPGTVTYLDYEAALRGPDGGYPVSYVAADGTTVHLRKADDWHFCADGAERLAAEVNRQAHALGLMALASDGWQQGAWRSAAAYDDPACR